MYTELRSGLWTRHLLSSKLSIYSLSSLLLWCIHTKPFLTNSENIVIFWCMLMVWITFTIYNTAYIQTYYINITYNNITQFFSECWLTAMYYCPCIPYINPINLHDNTEASAHHLHFLLETKDLHPSDVIDIASCGVIYDRIRIRTLAAS